MIALAVLAGCTDDDEGAVEVSPDGALTLSEFVPRYVRAGCEREVRCALTSDSVDACVAAYDAGLARGWQRKVEAQAQGRVAFDASQAAACLAAQTSTCSSVTVACNKVTTGMVVVRDSCIAHFECAPQAGGVRTYCFEGCVALTGAEEVAGNGICAENSPIGTAACP